MALNRNIQKIICFIGIALLFGFSVWKFVYDVRELIHPVNDLIAQWGSSKVFLEGKNPYDDHEDLVRIWETTENNSFKEYNEAYFLAQFPTVYPPTALLLHAPLALLPWRTAVYTNLVGSTVLFVAMILLLAQKLQFPWSNPRKLFFVAFALSLAPLHTGIHQSNISTLTVALLGLGLLNLTKRPYLSGVALAVVVCMKPQVGFLFILYPWLRRKWKTAWTGMAACAMLSAATLLWLRIHGVDGIRAYLSSMGNMSTLGSSVFSFYAPGPDKFKLVNLQVLVYQFIHDPHASNLITWAVFLILAMVSAYLIYTRVSEKNESIGIATVSVLTLLPVYQRIYTATILIFVLYWAIENWQLKRAKVVPLLMLPLLFPLVAMTRVGALARFVEEHHLSSNPLWNMAVMPHIIWIELILLAILLTVLYGTKAIARKSVAESATPHPEG